MSPQQLDEKKKTLFASVYARLPREEQKRVDEIITTWAGIPQFGPAMAKELLVSLALFLEDNENGQSGSGH